MPKLGLIAAGLVGMSVLAGAAHATPTTSFTLSGDIGAPGIYTGPTLQALPSTTATVTYNAGGSAVTDTFTGPTIWTLLQATGGITTDPAIKNDILRKYVIATGSDGYKAVIAAGEIAPKFGHKSALVAYGDTLGNLPVPDGFARIVPGGDKAGGRYVSNLADLHVGSAPAQTGTGGGTTTQFAVQGAVKNPLTDTLSTLQALTPHTETVTYMAGSTSVMDTYTGALLWDVLGSADILTDPAIKNDILRKLVIATGSDGYQVAFSLGELSPNFGGEPILVAYADSLGQLTGADGFARIVVPGDIAGGRYVSNLASLTVFDGTAVPEPASALLLLAGLAGVALLRRAPAAAEA